MSMKVTEEENTSAELHCTRHCQRRLNRIPMRRKQIQHKLKPNPHTSIITVKQEKKLINLLRQQCESSSVALVVVASLINSNFQQPATYRITVIFLQQTQTKPDKYSRKTTTIKLHKKSCSNFACVCVCCVYNKEKSLEILPFACVYVCIPTKLVSRSRSQHKKQALLQHPNYIYFLYFFFA